MNSYIHDVILIAIIIYLTIINFLNRKQNIDRENDLLNRILSDDFTEYVEGTKHLRRKPDEPLTSKERQVGVEAAMKIDADILEVG